MKPKLGFDLVILGAPASGKNTQADLLLSKFNLKAVESGKYLRKFSKTPEGARKLKNNFGKGLPAPIGVIVDFIKKNVTSIPAGKNLLFVGNPRLKPEAESLNRLLTQKGRDYLVIYLTLPAREIIKRTVKRLRDDRDKNPVYLKNRIRYAQTEDRRTLEYFRKLNKLRLVNGNRPKSAVAADIKRILHDR
ncbi:MAG: adenylate kinase family protein [Acidobacteriaceae bacterium]